jgi:hypothetical protein
LEKKHTNKIFSTSFLTPEISFEARNDPHLFARILFNFFLDAGPLLPVP